jgi:hypothetical protein
MKLALWLSCARAITPLVGSDIPFLAIQQGRLGIGPSVTDPVLIVANSPSVWTAGIEELRAKGAVLTYWQGNREKPSIPLSLEERIFEKSTIVAVFWGPSGGGDDMAITKLRTNGNRLEVHVTKISSHHSCETAAVITYPFSIVKTQRRVDFPSRLFVRTVKSPPCG